MSTHQSQLLDLSFVKMPNKTWDSKQNTRATTQARSIQQTSIIKIRFPESTDTHTCTSTTRVWLGQHPQNISTKTLNFIIIIHKIVYSNSDDHTWKRIQFLPETQRTEKFGTFLCPNHKCCCRRSFSYTIIMRSTVCIFSIQFYRWEMEEREALDGYVVSFFSNPRMVLCV